MKNEKTIPTPWDWGFWKAYFIHMRPYLLFISGVAGLAGMAAVSNFQFMKWQALFLFFPFFFAYGFGQALTDCSQVDTDRTSAPYRPLSQGIVTPRAVGIVSLLGLALCAVILIYFNYWNIVFCTLSVIGLATYSYFKKRFWFAGPFYNSWIVALLPVMGFLSASGGSLESLNNPALASIILLNFFAYANFVLMGYLKDIGADRETGYRTFPVVFGWDATVWVGDIFVVLSILFCSQVATLNPISITCLAIASVLAISGQVYGHLTKNKTEKNAAFPITMTIRSFVLWNLAVILAFHQTLVVFSLAYYVLFELVLYRRPMKGQI